MNDELLNAYRALVAELLVHPTDPCTHEGTDLAVSDFDNYETAAYDDDPRRILRQLSDNTMRKLHERVLALGD
jgi:hypothetical protein